MRMRVRIRSNESSCLLAEDFFVMSLNSINPSDVHTIGELAPLLSSTEEEINLFLAEQEKMIQHGKMRKPNGEFRDIVRVTNDSYRHFLRDLNSFITLKYNINSGLVLGTNTVHGFVKGKSIVTNAQQHTQKTIVLNVDIKSFFDSISANSVQKLFESLGFKEDIANVLTRLTTVNGILPTGFSTSPTISNSICLVMDGVFKSLSEKREVTYTRYVDDMTFSSDVYLPSKSGIAEVLETFGFKINENKYRIYRKGGPQYVTGLTVVDKKPRLSKKFKRSLRLEAYYIKKFGFLNHFCYVTRKTVNSTSYHIDIACKTELLEYLNNPKSLIVGRLTNMMWQGYGLEGFISYINAIEPEIAKQLAPLMPNKSVRNFDLGPYASE